MSKKVTLWVSPGFGRRTFRIHLKEGQTRVFTGFRYTDEGTDSFYSSFAFKNGVVIRKEETDGRDCDGRMSTSKALLYYPEDRKYHRPYPDRPRMKFPTWELVRDRQRDYAAEAAGY